MSDNPEKLDLQSQNPAEVKREELKRILPEVFTEGGKIDFDQLKRTLGEWVDSGKERYGMQWPGKADCLKSVQQTSLGTLLPVPDESVNFDSTENMIIEGDNLEVLKLLQKSYVGKVKMIYIDPPYNTGNDFIYPDNYSENLQTYLEYTGQVDGSGKKFSTNTDADGRFHSKWMNMMYPRLFLARNLLKEDGVIFISVDDNEVSNLRKICDEVFGEENFITKIVWQKIHSTKNDAKFFSDTHEYLMVFTKYIENVQIKLLPRTEKMDSRFSNPDNDPRGLWSSGDLVASEERKEGRFEICGPTGVVFNVPQGKHWVYSKDNLNKYIKEGRIWFGKNGNAFPRLKRYLSEVQQGRKCDTIWLSDEVGHNQESMREVKSIFNDEIVFNNPKPVRLLSRIMSLTMEEDEVFLDFYSGSGSSAHAVLDLNKKDSGNRKFILVQLPEPTERKDFPTIAEITKERVRRVIKKLDQEESGKLDLNSENKQDRGFKVFKLAPSNFKVWDASQGSKSGKSEDRSKFLQSQLQLTEETELEKRSELDFLYEIILKDGFLLTEKVEVLMIADKKVYCLRDLYYISLESDLTSEFFDTLAKRNPNRLVCLESAFGGDDALKSNAVQLFKTREAKLVTV